MIDSLSSAPLMILSGTTSREPRDRRGAPSSLGHRARIELLSRSGRGRFLANRRDLPCRDRADDHFAQPHANMYSCALEGCRKQCYRLTAAGDQRGDETTSHEFTGPSQGIAENGAAFGARLNVCTLRISAM